MISYQTDPGPEIHIASHDNPSELPGGALDSWGPCQLQLYQTSGLVLTNLVGRGIGNQERICAITNYMHVYIYLMGMSSEEPKVTF